jgi:hypothetical protein
MLLSMHNRPSDVDHFLYQLGMDLGKSVAEVLDLEAVEILNWRAFYIARASIQNQRSPEGGQRGSID